MASSAAALLAGQHAGVAASPWQTERVIGAAGLSENLSSSNNPRGLSYSSGISVLFGRNASFYMKQAALEGERRNKLAGLQEAVVHHAVRFPASQKLVSGACSVSRRKNVIAAVLPDTRGKGLRLGRTSPEWPHRGLPTFPEGTAARGKRSQTVAAAKKPNVVLSESEQELLRQMGQLYDSKQQEVQKQMEDMKKQFADQKQLLGSLVEASARQEVSRIFGENYVKQLLARSLQDLALLLPEERCIGAAHPGKY
ncbi:hypothetical protein KFL_012300010 [Klebsormidium nitens]|uniref:Uncharacterized protein n=1 Tax=Klebsormidium nitens TaxID=105231 RepID=A0A1Y1IUE7_KLENI|nr:hypothetical protein KFL_012300010 [Klebsormidium nitens]|eukprot:GAQ92971.1 hypothetical protein KFL_012300010 [Klebsormidium nitens]